MARPRTLLQLERQVIRCTRCPRLVEYCQQVGRVKKRAFAKDDYWARPVPGFGDPNAWLVIVGLAPAAHGANRTGRMFTGDGSDGMGAADFLARGMHRAGLANQPTSRRRGDGLEYRGAFLTAICRCAPPGNKPTSVEIDNCASYLQEELRLLKSAQVVLALGKLAFDQMLRLLEHAGATIPRPRPKFGHSASFAAGDRWPVLLGSYHPSRQNTQTGKLTEKMFDAVFKQARNYQA